MNQAVTEYIEKIDQTWQAEVCKQLRTVIFQVVPDAEERIQYGKPHYRKNGKDICVFNTAKSWVSLTIFHAQALEAPQGVFEPGSAQERKTIKISEAKKVDDALLAELLQQVVQAL
jgi:hypothetical protein